MSKELKSIVSVYFSNSKKEYNSYIREKKTLLEDFCVKEVPIHLETIFDILAKGVEEGKDFLKVDLAVQRYCRDLINKELGG